MLERQFGFHGASETLWFLFLSLAVLAAGVCIVLLYRYERRLVSGTLGFLLLGLRLAAVAVIFLALLEPVLTWQFDRDRTGRVIVAVDVSESMETADKHAGDAEKLRLARALGMTPRDAAANERIDRWIEAYESGREPEWVSPQEVPDPERARQLAEVRRETTLGQLSEIEKLPRSEIAYRLLTQGESPLLDAIDERAVLELAVFAGTTSPSERESLEQLVHEPPETLAVGASNMSASVSFGLQSNADTPLAGVVVLTDGRDNAHSDAERLLGRLRSGGVPVYPVMVGSTARPQDLAISEIDSAPTVYQDDQAVAKVTLRTNGFEGRPLTVRLVRDDDSDGEPDDGAEQQEHTITPVGGTASVEFELDATELGRRRYTVSAEVQPGETREDNNSKSFLLHVVDDESDILLVDGEARWEFRFIEAALDRDEHVALESVLYRQPYMGLLPETFFPREVQLPPDPAAATKTPFAEFDAVLIGDVAPHHLQSTGWDLLDRYVREEGGTLVLIAGKRHMPRAYGSAILDDLLPVEQLRTLELTGGEQTGAPRDRGFRLQLTPDGLEQPMLQFDTDDVENRRIWSTLPGHMWGLAGRAKPGCTVWASVTRPGDEGNLQAERENAILVHQYLGAGQVVWIGIDSTWRWRDRVGDEYHHRFWGQLSRWAAEFKATAGNQFVRFGAERPTIELGEDALLRALWTETFLNRFPDLKARAEVLRADDLGGSPVMTVDLKAMETKPLVHEARATGLPGGEYRVRLMVENADLGGEDIFAELTVIEPVTTELSELAANRDLLEQIAAATGGRFFFPHQLDELPSLFEDVTQSESIRDEVSLWDHWLTLVVFCGLLGSEWVLRKINGLP